MSIPQTRQIASFALRSNLAGIPKATAEQLKRHLLDAMGSFIYATQATTIAKLTKALQIPLFNTRWEQVAADKAALLYTALIRYPDFMDNFLGKEATCHPSDNIGPLLAVTHRQPVTGSDFLCAMAVAYQVECRLVEQIPVMINGFDHTVLLAISATAGIGKLFGMTEEQIAAAIGIAGCSQNPLVSSRASYTTEWKGLASSLVTQNTMQIAQMAANDITGPVLLFEIPEKGFNDIQGMPLTYDWSKENFDLVKKCALKSYNAEVHTQSAIEAVLMLREKEQISPADITHVAICTFLTSYHIVGGGEYGSRDVVRTKEQADHSLPYVIAVALLDGKVMPEQLLESRILQNDVQSLLKKIQVQTKFPFHKPVKVVGLLDKYTAVYPEKLMAKVTVTMKDGKKYTQTTEDYHGYYTRPFSWSDTVRKFRQLSNGIISADAQQKMIEMISDIEHIQMEELLSCTWAELNKTANRAVRLNSD